MRRKQLLFVAIATLILAAGAVIFYLSRPTEAPPPVPHAPRIVSVVSSADAEEAWVLANNAMEAEEFDRAIAGYDEALRRDPKFVLALAGRGNARLSLQQYDAALADYTAAIKQEPDSPDAYLGRGTTNWLLGRLPEAARDFRKLTEMYPDNSFYAIRLSNILHEAGKGNEVEELFHAAYERNHDSQWALGLWLGAVLLRSPDAMIQQGQELNDSGVDTPELREDMGAVFLKRKDYLTAIHWLEPLLSTDVTEVSPDALFNLATAYAATGQNEKCQSTIREFASRMGRANQFRPEFCLETVQP